MSQTTVNDMRPTNRFEPPPELGSPVMLPRPYRVLLVDIAQGFGGVEKRVLCLAQALQSMVAHCSVAVLDGSALSEQLRQASLPAEVIRYKKKDPRVLLQLWRVIHREGYEVVDAHNIPSILYGHLAAMMARVRGRVTTIHSFYAMEYPGVKGKLCEGVLALDRLVTRQYINVTEHLHQRAVAHTVARSNTLIPNAVAVPKQITVGKDPRLIAEWGFSPDDYIIAVIARLYAVKGHTYLFQAFTQLSDLPHVKLLIIGDGPLYTDLNVQASQLGIANRVFFTGFRMDVSRILQSVDCVCLASLTEGLPYAILEAAAYARPIVATAVGGVQTLFANSGAAVMVAPRDPNALAASIRWVVEHPDDAQRMGQAAYDLISRSCSVDRMLVQTLKVYDRVAV